MGTDKYQNNAKNCHLCNFLFIFLLFAGVGECAPSSSVLKSKSYIPTKVEYKLFLQNGMNLWWFVMV